MDPNIKIKELEDELKDTQYNKATQHHFGVVKARIAKLREKAEKKSGASTTGWSIKKSGDATVAIVGFPSVGKSTLLNKITGAKSKTAAYAFTTLTVVPGILQYKCAKIQLLDLPGIIEEAARGKGRGKEVLGMARASDLVLLVLDALQPEKQYKALLKEIYECGIRLNQRKPDVKITKRSKGGISIHSTQPLDMDEKTITDICKEMSVINADIVIRDKINEDQLIDAIEGNKIYIPSTVAITKIDLIPTEERERISRKIPNAVMVCGEAGTNIEALKEAVYNSLKLIAVYLKEVNKPADMEVPLIIRSGSTIKNVCEHIHRQMVQKFKYARLWGKTAKFPGQSFRDINKEIHDKDIVEIHTK